MLRDKGKLNELHKRLLLYIADKMFWKNVQIFGGKFDKKKTNRI